MSRKERAMKKAFKQQIVDLLDRHRIITIATNPDNDYPQALQIQGLWIAAQAVETTDPNERAHAREILLKRYPEYKIMPPPDPATVPLIRMTPEVVSVLDYSKGFGHADLLRVSDDDLEDFIEARRHHWASFHAA